MALKKTIGEGFGRGELYDVLSDLTTDVEGLTTDVEGLTTDVGGLTTDVGDLTADVALLMGEMPYIATINAGAETSDKVDVTIQLKNYSNENLAKATTVIGYISSLTGITSITATGTTGTVETLLANSTYRLTTDATGKVVVQFGTVQAGSFYFNVALPNGTVVQSAQITFAGA